MSTAPASPTPRGLEHVQHEVFARLFRRVVRIRASAAPFLLVLLVAFFLEEPAVWRRCLLGGLLVLLVVSGVSDYRDYRRGTPRPGLSFAYLAGTSLPALAGMILLAGGIEGPLTPLVIITSFVITFFTTTRGAWAFAVLLVALLWGLTAVSLTGVVPDLLPHLFGGGTRAGHNNALLLTYTGVLSLLAVWIAGVGSLLRDVFQGMVKDAQDARDETLRVHTEVVSSLTTLSGEIAHELKNPLASVKGLAAMLARDVEGKPAERLAVLRREVDRMQEILEGFLNFSRPLVPLQEQRMPMDGLCRQVAELHEGMAAERGVTLRVFAEQPVAVWCDPRKVKQVLINLVQNALEASPRGRTVEFVVLPAHGGGVRVEVRDRGPGVPATVRERVFEPGVTTKAKGSGLGLAIARALARQHGGELMLRSREGGGCVAELVLPAGAPSQAGEEAVA